METPEILARLDVLIRLQAASAVRDIASQKGKIEYLADLGLAPAEIAKVLNTSANAVSVTLYKRKKSASKTMKESMHAEG